MNVELPWWKTTTIYQVYPRSFRDSDGDGIGDLQGIISKLDYIRDLGFETIWFSPFFDSPQGDWGYDVRDYMDVAREYGSLADAERLIDEVHNRGIRVLFDLVMNHTSSEHRWFQDSRSSRESPKRDWYIWRDGRDGRPPNNWKAIPGGSGWHYDQTTKQWYYASFLPFQPDLNYRNPQVKAAMFDVARYWLDKGVDGFRLDIFHAIYKDADFRDNPLSWHLLPHNFEAGYFQDWKYNLNLPETRELAKALRAHVEARDPDSLLLGEIFGSEETVKGYLGENLDGLNLVFLWELLNVKTRADFFRNVVRHYEQHYPAPYLPVLVYGNHDQKRVISKVGEDTRIMKLLALFQFTARGVPVTYYGEEIGMVDGGIPAGEALDPIGQRYSWAPQFLMDALGIYVNRDGCRTPMQWNRERNAGFSDGDIQPWLPINRNYQAVNVAEQRQNPESILNTYRALLRLRRESAALQAGSIELVQGVEEELLAYRRVYVDQKALILINFGSREVKYQNKNAYSQVWLAVGMEKPVDVSEFCLPPYAGLVLGK